MPSIRKTMRKTTRLNSKQGLGQKQLFFLSKAQISNSTFIFGNMYSLHFSHYLKLNSSCKKGALSLDDEYNLLAEKLEETARPKSVPVNDNSNSASSENSSGASSTSNMSDDESTASATNSNSTINSLSEPPCAMSQAPQPSPIPHENSIACCIAPGLPFILQNFQKLSKSEIQEKIRLHLARLDAICRQYNKMLIVIGYLPVFKGQFLKSKEASKINDILMLLDNIFSKHSMFRTKFVKYFQVSRVLKEPEMRKCGIYPTSGSYLLIGEKLQEFIFNLSK